MLISRDWRSKVWEAESRGAMLLCCEMSNVRVDGGDSC
jgi:hypothetical protein